MHPSFHLDKLLTLYGVVPFLRRRKSRKPFLPILMYHSITDDPEFGVHGYYRVTTSPARFREQMLWLKGHGYNTVTIDEGIKRLKTNPTDPVSSGQDRNVVLTFDDGYQDFLTKAWPLLRELSYSATVFLPTAFISEKRKSFQKRYCMNWTEIRELNRCDVSFGSHSVNHPILYDKSWKEIRLELRESKHKIEGELQKSITNFCYPYAFPQEDQKFVLNFQRELAENGYQIATTTIIGCAGINSNPLSLQRIPISEFDDINLFSAKLEGAYDWLAGVQNLIRRTKSFQCRRLDNM